MGIPGNCYGRHLSPPRDVEYSVDVWVTLESGEGVEYTVEWAQSEPLEWTHFQDVEPATRDILESLLAEEGIILNGEDIEDVMVCAVRETR